MRDTVTQFYLGFILSFLKDAGEVALGLQHSAAPQEKPDRSLVTQADLAISKLFNERITQLPDAEKHFVIDEETESRMEASRDKIENAEYTWILDPIDGTTPYAHRMPFWGIFISIYKRFTPWLSAIYLLATGELIYTDGLHAYFEDKKNGLAPVMLQTPHTLPLGPQTPVLAIWSRQFDDKKHCMMDVYCAACFAAYTILGRSAGSFFGKPMKLWDIAALLPIINKIGLQLISTRTDQALESVDLSCVDDAWRLQDLFLLCQTEQYQSLKLLLKSAE